VLPFIGLPFPEFKRAPFFIRTDTLPVRQHAAAALTDWREDNNL
jgi:hypothetical protein